MAAHDSGVGCLTVIGAVLIAFKLAGVIAWSWGWVLAPFWGPFALGALIVCALAAWAAIKGGK